MSILLDIPIPEWQAKAKCAEHLDQAADWFPDRGSTASERAKMVCQKCPVLETCRDWAIDYEATYGTMPGIYGGLTLGERRAVRQAEDVKAACHVCGGPMERGNGRRYCSDTCRRAGRRVNNREALRRHKANTGKRPRKRVGTCLDCGVPITQHATRCKTCNAVNVGRRAGRASGRRRLRDGSA